MKRVLVLAAAVLASSGAQAAGVGVRVGTTGLGGDIAFGVAPTLSARLGYSGGTVSHTTSTSTSSYDGDVKLSNLNALLDFHPLGPFRLTGGVIFNDNKYTATGRPNGAPGSFSAEVKSGNRAAPYLGIGYGNVAGMGINFYADLGVMFMGSPKATITPDCSGLTAGQCSTLQGQASAEHARLEDELKRFKAYPVLSIGLTIGF